MTTQTPTREYQPPEPEGPPISGLSPTQWVRVNLFNSWYNSLLTLILGPVIVWLLYRVLGWVLLEARWEIVQVNLTSFMVGRFPRAELWRIWVAVFVLGLVVGLGAGMMARAATLERTARGLEGRASRWDSLRRAGPGLLLLVVTATFVRTPMPVLLALGAVGVVLVAFVAGRRIPPRHRRWVNLSVLVGLVIAYQVMVSGVPMGRWGGFMLNMFFTIAGITLAFPIGVLLALGRRSTLPAVRLVCVSYIEVFRGLPLIALLFGGWLLIGFFLPRGFPTPNLIVRALIIFIMFTAAYIAEIVRGGLQSIPRGQSEAGMALGLQPWKVTRLIVLPQALRNVIPATVGQFISLYKDTVLVFIIGVTEVLTVARSVTQQPRFLGQGLHTETLLFASFLFWVGSYWMSRESQRMERRLGVGER